jgi:predicted secreted protein
MREVMYLMHVFRVFLHPCPEQNLLRLSQQQKMKARPGYWQEQ